MSIFHPHSADSTCLSAITEVPYSLGHMPKDDGTLTADQRRRMVAAVPPGWFVCSAYPANRVTGEPYYVHNHGGRFVSHFVQDGKALGCAA